MHRSRPIVRDSMAVLAFVLAPALAGLAAYWHAFSSWARFDDEGSHLQLMKLFLEGHPLYSSLDAYHGPVHFELWSLLYRFDPGAVSSDGARFVVVAIWTATALAAGLVVRRVTGSTLCGIAGLIVWWSACFVLANEPGHPISTVVLLLCAAGAVIVLAIESQPRRGMLMLGLVSGALLMTKINVGLLMLLAVAFAAGVTLPSMRRFRPAAVIAGVALPFVLMYSNLGSDDWLRFALVVAVASGAIAASAAWRPGTAGDVTVERRVLATYLAGCAGVAAMAIVILLPFGTALGDVLYTAFLGPAGHPSLFMIALPVPAAAFAVMAASVAGLLTLRFRQLPTSVEALVRFTAGLVIWFTAAHEPNPDYRTSWPLLVPTLVAWVTVLPPRGVARTVWDQFANTVIAAAAVFETLHAYPVAGSQRGSSTVLFVFVGASCIRSALHTLQSDPVQLRRARVAIGTAALALLIPTVVIPLTRSSHDAYEHNVALPFDGATHVRLPKSWTHLYANVVFLLKHECDAMVSEPGYPSLNFWSGLPVLADMTMDEWMPLTPASRQQTVVDELYAHKRPCAVRDHVGVAFWMGDRAVPQKPLVRAIASMTTVAQIGSFEFAVPNWRVASVNRDLDKRVGKR